MEREFGPEDFTPLTVTEKKVLKCYAEGLKGRGVAARLNMSVGNLKKRQKEIRSKLYAKTVKQALTHAYVLGELKLPTIAEIIQNISDQKGEDSFARARDTALSIVQQSTLTNGDNHESA